MVRGNCRGMRPGRSMSARSRSISACLKGNRLACVRKQFSEKPDTREQGSSDRGSGDRASCAVVRLFSAVFLIRAVYTYGLIQHALTETAREMASSGYIYHISGIRDLHDTVRDTINDRTDVLQAQAESLLEAYNGLFGTDQAASADLPDVIETIVGFVAGRAFDEAKTQLFIPVVRQCMKNTW